ncbi:site-2 protease family protein [Hamadaea tsunoensis]|uniref:site-2 protease family protein n=1 Tax=Hamadaea tsunoensis TaxID=53368 RepID=UPI000427212A|nr:site-2 protease family protein [Hamadaea tsunoensis]
MTNGERDYDDPLQRLAAEEDWDRRARAVEQDVARQRRKAAVRGAATFRRRSVRVPGNPRGISWIFVALLALTGGSAYTLWAGLGPAQLSMFVFILAAWLVSLSLHEFSHALTAHRGGDDTVAEKGYLRLNPLKYGHPVLTIILPLIFLMAGGLPLPGGAVLIESHRLRSRWRDSMVSAAGPLINIVLAAGLLTAVATLGPDAIWTLAEPHAAFWAGLSFLAYLQVAAAVLNLLPIPGIDGYGIIEPFLPDSVRATGRKIMPFGVLLFFLVLSIPFLRNGFSDLLQSMVDAAGVPVNGVAYGDLLFEFWR